MNRKSHNGYSPEIKAHLEALMQMIRGGYIARPVRERLLAKPRAKSLAESRPEILLEKANPIELFGIVFECSRYRAVLEIAHEENCIDDRKYQRLLNTIGESGILLKSEADEMIEAGYLVLGTSPRRLYWRKELVKIDWSRRQSGWHFLEGLVRQAKQGDAVDTTYFTEDRPVRLRDRKHRLTAEEGFPSDLAGLIVDEGFNTYRLYFPAERIYINDHFEP